MNQEEKSQMYSQLLFEFDKMGNQISSIKGESIELDVSQNQKIRNLQINQEKIISEMKKLMS